MMLFSTKTSAQFIVIKVCFTSINLYVKVFLFMLKYSLAGYLSFFLRFFGFFTLLNLNRLRRLNVKYSTFEPDGINKCIFQQGRKVWRCGRKSCMHGVDDETSRRRSANNRC